MAEEAPNGTIRNGDVEMKEEVPVEAQYNQPQHDPTDPNPPPQSSVNASTLLHQPETPSSTLPAAATPPASAAPARPGSMPPQPSARPEKPVAHGGPTRQFLNSNITPHLLEGMKHLAVYTPEKPLLWLSEFLRDKSKELEGS